MRLIFLDIDGVLNIYSPSYYTSRLRKDQDTKWVEPHLVERLEWLIEHTDAYIVVSSSWRTIMDDLKYELEREGFRYWDKVIGKTPVLKHRGEEIKAFLDSFEEPIEAFVVLEDEIEDVCGEKCNEIDPRFVVEVDSKNGLTHQNIEKAYEILTKFLQTS